METIGGAQEEKFQVKKLHGDHPMVERRGESLNRVVEWRPLLMFPNLYALMISLFACVYM